ncbi:MAG TPA: CHAD domain-containing protein [Stellaceae bacterium]|nr:CHAD domain-containing protein [Stellaceae bacterium]
MASEVELKLELPAGAGDAVADLPWLKELASGPVKREKLVSVYFDTAKLKLHENGLTLRIRRAGNKRLQTIKAYRSGARGAFNRDEWEQEVRNDRPDLALAHGTALEPLVTKKLKRKLRPVFETLVERTVMPIRFDGSEFEIAIDRGQVKTGARRRPINELEIELKRGSAAALPILAERFARSMPAAYGARSKAERGYALSRHENAQPVGADPIVLDPAALTGEAFSAIGLSCLHHAMANQDAIAAGDAEGIHEMRVGLRRLRAAISVFKELNRGSQTEAIKSELKWLTDELGPAREFEVLIEQRVRPLRKAEPDTGELATLEEDLDARRRRGLDKAKAALASERYRRLGLRTALWLANGNWAHSTDELAVARRERPATDFAAEMLRKRTRKIARKIGKLEELTARERHKLRIAIKKLRYATEFFASLFDRRKQAARRKKSGKILKALQNSLGTLNDIEVHKRLARTVVHPTAPIRKKAEKAFAMGFITGQEQGRIAACLGDARTMGRRLSAAPQFWQ